MLSAAFQALVATAYAAGVQNLPTNIGGFDTPSGIVHQICLATDWIFTGAIILSIIFTLLAAIEYMRSSGDPAKVTTATNRLMYAAIGVAVALVAFTLPAIVASLLNVSYSSAC